MPNFLENWVILVVDDHYDNVTVAQTTLEYYGATVHIANNGQDGLALAQSVQPKVILLDLSMPIMNGWDMLDALRRDPTTRYIPTIAVTAYAMNNDRERVLEVGFDGYIAKPYDVLNLVSQVQAVVAAKNGGVAHV